MAYSIGKHTPLLCTHNLDISGDQMQQMFKTGIACDEAHRKENDQHGPGFACEGEVLDGLPVNGERVGEAVHQRRSMGG